MTKIKILLSSTDSHRYGYEPDISLVLSSATSGSAIKKFLILYLNHHFKNHINNKGIDKILYENISLENMKDDETLYIFSFAYKYPPVNAIPPHNIKSNIFIKINLKI